jgi:hypothetical protein
MKHPDPFTRRLAARHVRPARRPAVQTGLMTMDRLLQLIREGYGQGHLDSYLPWLRVTKLVCSPVSTLSRLHAKEFGHKHHPRSRAQRNLLNQLAWCGVFDARDHYPIWPWTHAHPVDGLLLDQSDSPQLRGSIDIGEECGLQPGCYIGTSTPRVLTLHCLSTIVDDEWNVRLVAHQIVDDSERVSDDIPRSREFHVLRSRYCDRAGIPFVRVPEASVRSNLSANLDAIRPQLTREATSELRSCSIYKRAIERLQSEAYQSPANAVMARLVTEFDLSPSETQTILNVALWHQDVDHDLARPLELRHPLIEGGLATREAARERLVLL